MYLYVHMCMGSHHHQLHSSFVSLRDASNTRGIYVSASAFTGRLPFEHQAPF